MAKPTTRQLVEATGISRTYAHDILSGKQNPSRPLAIHILRKTNWRHEIIADIPDDDLATFEAHEPWERAA